MTVRPACSTRRSDAHWRACLVGQYAQLTITADGWHPHGARTILWHGPGQGIGENYSDTDHTVLELLNRFGADGWELAGLQDYREGGDGSSYWEAAQLLTVYTFKRPVPSHPDGSSYSPNQAVDA